jgi:peptide/nickel transport system substrate-binding protein
MGFNLHDPKQPARPHPIFGDARVRRAISMALDRRGMLRNVFDTLGAIAYGPFPRSLGSADTTLRLPPFDTTHAAALLDSLGWKRGADGMRARDGHPLAFTLQVPTSSRVRMTYATLIQDQLRRLGITVDIGGMQFPEFMAHQDARDFDASLNAYSTDPSPGGYTQNWGSGGAHKGGSNSVGYSNPVFDALLDSALTSFDPARARAYAVRAYQVLADDAPAVWLYDVLTVGAISTRIHTTPLRADEWWAHMADWTIPPAERIDRDRIGLGAAKP